MVAFPKSSRGTASRTCIYCLVADQRHQEERKLSQSQAASKASESGSSKGNRDGACSRRPVPRPHLTVSLFSKPVNTPRKPRFFHAPSKLFGLFRLGSSKQYCYPAVYAVFTPDYGEVGYSIKVVIFQ